MRENFLSLQIPYLGEEEIRAVVTSMKSMELGGDGPKGRELEKIMENYLGLKYAFLVTSGTSALEISMMVAGVGQGDEVILPSFAFVSAANVVLRQGARPVFVEIEKDTFNIDPESFLKAITPETKAVIVIHYAGHACRMEDILKIADEHDILVVEDAAHAIGAKYNVSYLGTLGRMGCFSFHQTKNIICGEGGAIVTNNEDIAKKIEIIREKGTNRSSFLRGERDKYTWMDIGGSYVLSDLLAAILIEQFQKLEAINKMRRRNALTLTEKLKDFQDKIILPVEKEYAKSNWSLYSIRVKNKERRDWFIEALKAEGIGATFHFIPLHSSPYGKNALGCKEDDLLITEEVSQSLVRLPLFAQMTEGDLDDIARAVKKILPFI
ncbi:dTDP-4-amino-4,6-dideoxygalactose transaminase [bacterium]|nr:dTDP-4-amino-4,6-dideoxygalactose transaminase [bacterium]